MRIYHSGTERPSTDVNTVWRERLSDKEGYGLHRTKLGIAHDFAEGLRRKDWDQVCMAVGRYVKVRVELCQAYMTGKCWDIQAQCEAHGAESFPLGAGGGGAVLIFSPCPEKLAELDEVLARVFRRIDFRIRPRGHEFGDLPRGSE
jgi:D-glycero-alpha-D-manno-heptose-7-phosphate kinase